MPRIIGLSIGAVAAYLANLLLNTLSDRWSRSSGRDGLRGANDIAMQAKAEERTRKAFNDFTGVIAPLLFRAAAGAVLIWASPNFAVFLVGVIGLLCALSEVIFASNEQPSSQLKA